MGSRADPDPPPTGHETLSSAVTGIIFNTNS